MKCHGTDFSCEGLNSNLDNTWQAYRPSAAMHAKDTPESKANMLTQFPWIASEVFLAVCCQANSMILSLLFLIPVFVSPLFSLFLAFLPPPSPNGTLKSPGCSAAALPCLPIL